MIYRAWPSSYHHISKETEMRRERCWIENINKNGIIFCCSILLVLRFSVSFSTVKVKPSQLLYSSTVSTSSLIKLVTLLLPLCSLIFTIFWSLALAYDLHVCQWRTLHACFFPVVLSHLTPFRDLLVLTAEGWRNSELFPHSNNTSLPP